MVSVAPITPVDAGLPVVLVHARGMMTADEVDFWQQVRVAFRRRGNELVLVTYQAPKVHMDVPYALVPSGLDCLWRAGGDACAAALGRYWAGEEDDHFLVPRDAVW